MFKNELKNLKGISNNKSKNSKGPSVLSLSKLCDLLSQLINFGQKLKIKNAKVDKIFKKLEISGKYIYRKNETFPPPSKTLPLNLNGKACHFSPIFFISLVEKLFSGTFSIICPTITKTGLKL